MTNKIKAYFGDALAGVKTLLTGMDTSMGEYVTTNVTEQYPENRRTQHVAARHRGRLRMVRDSEGQTKCTACKLCELTCPNGSIKVSTQTVETEDGKKQKVLKDYRYDLGCCMFCQLCINVCPRQAIEFTNEFENAVFSRHALVQHLDKKEE